MSWIQQSITSLYDIVDHTTTVISTCNSNNKKILKLRMFQIVSWIVYKTNNLYIYILSYNNNDIAPLATIINNN